MNCATASVTVRNPQQPVTGPVVTHEWKTISSAFPKQDTFRKTGGDATFQLYEYARRFRSIPPHRVGQSIRSHGLPEMLILEGGHTTRDRR